jgi:hypothetical protein
MQSRKTGALRIISDNVRLQDVVWVACHLAGESLQDQGGVDWVIRTWGRATTPPISWCWRGRRASVDITLSRTGESKPVSATCN